jgi:hypothetical protein
MKFMLDKQFVLPLIASASALTFGSIFFISSWQYSEQWHEVLFSAFIVSSLILFVALRFKYKQLIMLIVMCLISILFYANLKFDWRKEYVLASNSGVHFAMGEYIDRYPLFEEHILPSLFNSPRWVDFNDDCLTPVLKHTPASRSCKSIQLIERKYGFNVQTLINRHYKKMKNTATGLEKGRIKNKEQLLSCIQEKKCVQIPLLPAGVNLEKFDAKSDDYLTIRTQFWSIINERKISPDNCEFMTLCRAMRDLGVVAIKKPNTDI